VGAVTVNGNTFSGACGQWRDTRAGLVRAQRWWRCANPGS
jgi:hypothetical protein